VAEYKAFLADTVVDGVRDLVLVPDGATPPGDHTSIGTFDHGDDGDSHVIYHHIRDLLYHQKIYDMQRILIKYDNEILPITFGLNFNEVTLNHPEEGAATAEINIEQVPGIANMGTYSVASSDTDKATVAVNNSTRVITITSVAVGTATITVSHNIMDHEEEIEVTISTLA